MKGEIDEEAILRQCIVMSKNSRLDASFWYYGSTNMFDVDVRLDAEYKENVPDNIIYAVKYGGVIGEKKSLTDIYQDLIALEYEYAEKQTALAEEIQS